MDVVQTIFLAVIVVILIIGLIVLNGIAKKFSDAVNKLLDELRPAVKSIQESVEQLRPSVEAISGKSKEIERVLGMLPDTLANYHEISEKIIPVARVIDERTPEVKMALESVSVATSRIREKAEEFNERVRPTFSTLSGLAQAFAEGMRVFKTIKK